MKQKTEEEDRSWSQSDVFESLASLGHLHVRVIIIIHESGPVPVGLPYLVHLFNWDILCLRQEEEDENGHHHHEEGEEEEQPEFHVAKHG